jgi:hypothetical protein
MFNFFKRPTTLMTEVANYSKTDEEIILEIHNEFDTAQDRLLDQADKLLSELNIPTETSIEQKAAKLKALGFVNSESVLQADKLIQKRTEIQNVIVDTKEQAELIKYHKHTYPFQKFLTESELDRICQKYGLIYAPVRNYSKDVPDKNINEISNADALKLEDIVRTLYYYKAISSNIKEDCPKIIKDHLLSGVLLPNKESCENMWYYVQYPIRKLYDIELKNVLKYYTQDYSIVVENKEGLFIAAPKSHFNLDGLTQKNKFSYLNVTIREIKDPIVFRYVRGGIQVLSKWGLEAQDESLINEKLN